MVWVTEPELARNSAMTASLGCDAGNDYASAGVLTPQEREIALMAASGLSNKAIGERLSLSHRTIGTHLYRVFPKLGITSRAALRDALKEARGDTLHLGPKHHRAWCRWPLRSPVRSIRTRRSVKCQ
jgi:DNA-binding NarL/FixJ family response regulator